MTDVLGNEIKVGDCIAIATQSYGEMKVGFVIDLVEKKYAWRESEGKPNMVRVITKGSTRWGDTYGTHLVVIDSFDEDEQFYPAGADEDDRLAKAFAYYKMYQAKKAYKETV